MGILDSVIGAVAGSVLGGNGNNQQQSLAMQLIAALLKQSGGAGNLLSQLQQSPLAGALASWISNGANQQVNGNDIISALGAELLGGVAQKVGVDNTTASNLLAQYLPMVINKITPNGTAADAQSFDLSDGLDVGDLAALASKFLK